MSQSQLWQFFKDQGISLADIAQKTGYHYTYVSELLTGSTPLTESAKLRFVRAFPATIPFLLPELIAAVGECN